MNALNQLIYENEEIVVATKYAGLVPLEERVVVASGVGDGTKPSLRGTAIFGAWKSDGQAVQIEGPMIDVEETIAYLKKQPHKVLPVRRTLQRVEYGGEQVPNEPERCAHCRSEEAMSYIGDSIKGSWICMECDQNHPVEYAA